MKVCVLGSGALGSSLGGILAEAGSDVHLVDVWAEHIQAINTHGLRIREGTVERTVRVRAATDCSQIGPMDLIIVLVKSYHTRQAIEAAVPIVGEKTVVLSLQNGLDNEETIAEVVGKERVLGGRTYAGCALVGPGQVIAGTKGKYTYLGELDGRITERVSRIAEQFNQAGLLTEVSPNIVGMMWDKLLINAATGALCGITRLPYGGLYQVPEVMECAVAAVSEGIAVADANGVKLSIRDPKAIWFKASAGLPQEFKPSILQSVEKGSRTEIDFINGSIVRRGKKCHVPTPVNQALVAAIKGIEHRMKSDPVSK